MAGLHRYAARARAALAAQPAPAPVAKTGPEFGDIIQQQLQQLQQAMLAPPSRSHPIGRRRQPRLPTGRPRQGLRDYPFCNLSDSPPLPTQADLDQASGPVLRLYQDSGGKLRRYQEAQEQSNIDQKVQTHPEPGPEPVQAQAQEEQGDAQNVDSGAAGGTGKTMPSDPALELEHRPDQ